MKRLEKKLPSKVYYSTFLQFNGSSFWLKLCGNPESYQNIQGNLSVKKSGANNK